MKVIINAKGSPELKEALRVAAFKNKKSASAYLITLLENDEQIKKELSHAKKR